MAFLKLLLNLGIIVAMTALPVNKNLENNLLVIDYRLPDNIKPIHYNIEFIINIEEGIYHGKSNINIKIIKETEYIQLHSANLAITETTLMINENVRLKRQSEKNNQLIYKPMEYSYNQERNIFIIRFSDKLLPGNYILNMEFFGEISNNIEGLFRTAYNNKKGEKVWLIATYLQPNGARQLFPCWDELELKAKFTISVKHPTKYTVLSNMPMINQQKAENNVMWTYFKTTPTMSPNLVAIAAIDFISLSDSWNIKVWQRENTLTPALFTYIDFFTTILEDEWYIITNKMIPKVDYVAIPDFPEQATVTWGLVLYRETNVISNLLFSHITHNKMEALRLIAHNIAQETLNNMPPWLNEGLARFLEIYAIQKNFQFSGIMVVDMLVVQIQHESFRLSSYFNVNLLQNNSEINSLPSSLRYNKAFSILRMLQYLVTDKVFQDGIKRYLNCTNTHINSATPNFWKVMQDALNKLDDYKNENNLIEKMDSWTKHKSYPILKVTRNSASYTKISLTNFDSTGSDLWIPITYTLQRNSEFNKTSLRDVIWLKSQNLSVDIPRNFKDDGWIIINLQQTGYYRVNYDTKNWKNIAKYLNSMEYTKIHVLNRAQIIDDAYYFLTIGQIDSSVFWKLTNYLSREEEYVAWYPMIKALEHMSSVFPLSNRKVYDIKKEMKKILNQLLQNIGYEESTNFFTNYLKQEAAKWACILGEPNCKIVAGSKLKEHLANRTNKLLPWWEEWTYCNGLMILGDSVWNDIFNIYIKESDNKYLKFLACSDNIAIIQNYTMIMQFKNRNEIMKNKGHINSFHFVIAKHAKNSIMLDYILTNFEKIKPKQASTVAIIIDLINHIYSEEQLNKIYQFVENYVKDIISKVKHKIKIRLSEIKNQIRYLQKLSNLEEIGHIGPII